jgi:hypothetical protein
MGMGDFWWGEACKCEVALAHVVLTAFRTGVPFGICVERWTRGVICSTHVFGNRPKFHLSVTLR